MKRRRILIALAAVVPVAVFIPAKIAASWRPVEIAAWPPQKNVERLGLWAGARYVSDGSSLFDLKTGRAKPDKVALLDDATWTWNWGRTGLQANPLTLQKKGRDVSFALSRSVSRPLDWDCVQIAPGSQLLQATFSQRQFDDGKPYLAGVCQWNLATRQLEIFRVKRQTCATRHAFSRDGQTLISLAPDSTTLTRVSMRTGQTVRALKLRGLDERYAGAGGVSQFALSRFGSVLLHCRLPADMPVYSPIMWGRLRPNKLPPGASLHYEVVSARTGAVLWRYQSNQWAERAFFSPDETQLAIPVSARKQWEIRDLQTGALIRTLPLLSGATTGAFSPDGATLYSVADGKLYRQRAR